MEGLSDKTGRGRAEGFTGAEEGSQAKELNGGGGGGRGRQRAHGGKGSARASGSALTAGDRPSP